MDGKCADGRANLWLGGPPDPIPNWARSHLTCRPGSRLTQKLVIPSRLPPQGTNHCDIVCIFSSTNLFSFTGNVPRIGLENHLVVLCAWAGCAPCIDAGYLANSNASDRTSQASPSIYLRFQSRSAHCAPRLCGVLRRRTFRVGGSPRGTVIANSMPSFPNYRLPDLLVGRHCAVSFEIPSCLSRVQQS